MRERNGVRYIIKVFEAQWDQLHDETVKPFFGQLKRDANETYMRRNGVHQRIPDMMRCSATSSSRTRRD